MGVNFKHTTQRNRQPLSMKTSNNYGVYMVFESAMVVTHCCSEKRFFLLPYLSLLNFTINISKVVEIWKREQNTDFLLLKMHRLAISG